MQKKKKTLKAKGTTLKAHKIAISINFEYAKFGNLQHARVQEKSALKLCYMCLLGLSDPPAMLLTKVLNRTKLILSIINVFRVMNPHQWFRAKQRSLSFKSKKDKKEEIWRSPITKAPTPTEMSKGQSDNTYNATNMFD